MDKKTKIKFRKWPEMQNWKLEWDAKYADRLAIVKEKIHGTNMQWIIYQDQVGDQEMEGRYKYVILGAKRTGFLKEEDTFYDWQIIRQKLQPILQNTLLQCATSFNLLPQHVVLRLYGELYGGTYPGVKSPQGQHKPIQRRIYYSPHIHWRAFAAEIEFKEKNEYSFLLWDELVEISNIVKLPLVPVYIRDVWKKLKYEDLIEHPIPVDVENENLKPLVNNMNEGVVVEWVDPEIRKWTFRSSTGRPSMFKCKGEKFLEVSTGKTREQTENKKKKVEDQITILANKIKLFLVRNRVENYMTKQLPSEAQDIKNMGLYIKEILQDAVQAYSTEENATLSEKQVHKLAKPLGRHIKDLINEWKQDSQAAENTR